ncbi:helix-turn-helix domain-containing protein [Klebsiella michiganensis]|uniref:Helix-turn-helix domain-containing protein n=1 Tax=Klebsiella michiganensis TaxID=1134687 RepID=A0A6P1UV80_9ENTR|nr:MULTISPECIES: YdaS family helix-turn-helix protein [Klebsiella]MBA7934068.1 helix-turn-helix domain-containing protein [Klebsiella sp. RHBSTW-00215]QHS46273.1 helix-turn-helix domain-containing protein [Klebsiella michiganensis]
MKEEIKTKITNRFSQREIGRLLGLKQQTVSQWINTRIPAGRVIPLCELMGWEVTPHELRPDLHPTPISGIPEGVIVPQRQSAEVNHENQA